MACDGDKHVWFQDAVPHSCSMYYKGRGSLAKSTVGLIVPRMLLFEKLELQRPLLEFTGGHLLVPSKWVTG